MIIDVAFLERCVLTLENALFLMQKSDPDNIEYDMYRSACIKEFEIILEQSGKLLRKVLSTYFHTSKEVDKLAFKQVFRNAVLRDLLSVEQCERWLNYRDNRNNTAHDYGENFAEETLVILPQFIIDANALIEKIKNTNSI
ncbi:MAG: nucleotidyltransferase [Sphingobacteriales bacterium]|jgi:nucleotidyltransferase substrate binding protein (TIGR01987 family)|nr:MAG: nucleotidyltransferase [Sphingobacteriales bacterium]